MVVVCLAGLLVGAAFLWFASRHFQTPDDRDATPEPFAPLAYLRLRPFDSAGYLALSESATASTPDGALRLRMHALQAATLLAPVDPQVIRAQAGLAFSRGEIRPGLDKTARLASISPRDRADAFHVLANYVNHPQWRDFAAARLTAGWDVSDQFLRSLCHEPVFGQQAFNVASQFVRYGSITPETAHCIENRVIASGDVQGAYRLRLNAAKSLPKLIGFVFNGDFELPLSGSAFDWSLEPGGEYREGFAAAIRPNSGYTGVDRALVVRFTGRAIRTPIAQQHLALPPGQYRFSYHSKQSVQYGKNSPTWTLRCVGSGTPLITDSWADSTIESGWIQHQVAFAVGVNCAGQLLLLEPKSKLSALEGLQGTLLLDQVRIEQR